MKKLEIILTEDLEQEIDEVVQLKSYSDYVAKEEDIILKVLELYTGRYKNMVKSSIKAMENALRNQQKLLHRGFSYQPISLSFT